MAQDDIAKRLVAEYEQLSGGRSNWEWQWEEIADLVLPRRDFTTLRSPGEKRANRIYDATAVWANEQLASGLHSFLTNPTLKWFALRLENARINDRDDVQTWLADTRDRLLAAFTSARSNFHAQAHELYMDLGAFGTSCMYITSGKRAPVVFNTRPLGEVLIRENSEGFVDSTFRKYKMTTRQAAQEFGPDALPDDIRNLLDKDTDKEFEFLHVIVPREDADRLSPRARSSRKPWASYHIALEKKVIVRESGFDEFPYVAPRWSKIAGETYGRSPAMNVLPDIKMLQQMTITVLKGAQKIVDPPLQAPDDGFLAPPLTIPGGINYYRASSKGRIEPILTGGRPDIGEELLDQRRSVILRAFYLDLFQLKEGPAMTATEVLQRREERLRLMAPMVSRLQSEFLAPLIDRVFAILWRRGLLLPPPDDIRGFPLAVDFVSPAALAQRTAEAENFARWLNFSLPLIQLDPQAAVVINASEGVRESARMFNISPRFTRPEEEVAEMLQQQAEQQQMAAALGQMQQAAEVGKTAAEAENAGR